MSPLVGLSRVRFDGYQLSWLNNEIYGDYQGLIPFIIEDETPRDERVPKETEHENQVTGIDTITLAAPDLDLAKRIMIAALGDSGSEVRDDELNASGVVYEVGTHSLEYLSPDDDSSPLHAHIDANAPVPFRVRFNTEGEKRTLSSSDAAGVRIEFV